MAQEIRQRTPTTTGGIVAFEVPELARHTEQLLTLELGREGIPVTVAVSFRPGFDGIGVVPEEVRRAASLILYATDLLSTRRVCDFRFQEEVPYHPRLHELDPWAIEAAKAVPKKESVFEERPSHDRGTVAAARRMDPPNPVQVMQLGSVTGRLRLGVFAPVPIVQLRVTCRIGTHIGGPISMFDDFFNPWRIAKMYNVTPENFAAVVAWLRAHRTALVLGTTTLERPDTGETLLHALCGACGDPRLAKLLVVNCTRFINVSHEAADGRTALHMLLENADSGNPARPRYHRCIELADLLVNQCAAPLDKQGPDGSTVLHLACRNHRMDSKMLPMLLDAGAGLFLGARDNEGLTALQVANDPQWGLLPPEVAQVEKLLARPVKPLKIRTLAPSDRLPDVDQTAGETTANLTMAGQCPPDAFEDEPDKPAAFKLSKAKLLKEFHALDENSNGWLSRNELRQAYQKYDHYGVVSTDSEMDTLVESLGIASDGRVTFDEYVLLVLKMARR